MLATREDSEAVAAIEKLTGIKLPRAEGDKADVEPVEEPQREERPSKGRRPAKAKTESRSAPEPVRAKVKEAPKSPSEDKGDWNGPVPGFLQFSAV